MEVLIVGRKVIYVEGSTTALVQEKLAAEQAEWQKKYGIEKVLCVVVPVKKGLHGAFAAVAHVFADPLPETAIIR